MNKKAIIVIPGLGGEMATNRVSSVVKRWNDDSYQVYIFDSKWESSETAEDKLKRLLRYYDEHSDGQTYLVAYSAGGALAIALLEKRPATEKCLVIAAKLKGSDAIGPSFQKRAPALLPIVQMSEEAIVKINIRQTEKIACLKPLFDEVVPKKDMSFSGVKTKTIPLVFHAPSIGFALLFQTKKLLK